MRPDEESKDAMGVIEMRRGMTALALAVCLSLCGGCAERQEIPVSALESSSREGMDREEGAGTIWDESGYEDAALPEELREFEIRIQGETYRLPADVQTLADRGWEYQGDPERVFDSDSFVEGEIFQKEDMVLAAAVLNEAGEASRAADCRIAGLEIDGSLPGNRQLEAELPGEISLGDATEAEVREAYGEPADRYAEEEKVFLTYGTGVYRSVQLGFDEETGILRFLKLFYIEETGEETAETSSGGAKEYREPERPGTSFAESVVEFGGDLYRIPAPVSAFEKNGWHIRREESEQTVEGGQYGAGILEREGARFYTVFRNPGSSAAKLSQCLVTEVSAGEGAAEVSMVLAGGVFLGMEEEAFLEIAGHMPGEEEFLEEEQAVLYRFYRNEAGLDYTEVKVDQTTGLVCQMKVVCNRDRDLEEQILEEE